MKNKSLLKRIGVNHVLNIATPIVSIIGLWIFEIPIYVGIGLVAIVFLHEFGHYVLMKYYGYENVKMFLILPIGGFIKGSIDRIKISREIIVILAGPVPGIIMGLIFLICSQTLFLDCILYYYLEMAGHFLIVMNAFNLLPIYPFDGGQIFAYLLNIKGKWLTAFIIVTVVIQIVAIFGYNLNILWYSLIPQVLYLIAFVIFKSDIEPNYHYDLPLLWAIGLGSLYICALLVPLLLFYV